MIADLVAKLIANGTPADVAAMVVAEAFAAGVSMHAGGIPQNSADISAERRRERDRNRKRLAKEIPQNSAEKGEIPQNSENSSLYKKERKKEESKKERGVTRASQIPDGWLPDEHVWRATVDLIGLERCNIEFAKFKNHAADKGRVSKSWNAAWRNWVDRSIEYRGHNGNGKAQDNPRAGSLIGALDRAIAKAELQENFGLEVPADNLLSLPSRSIQRS